MSAAPLRIVVITTVPQTMAAFFPRQLQSLAEAGFDVHAVSSPGGDLAELGRRCGVATHGIPMERQPSPLRDAASLSNLVRLMRTLRPHVVHAHTPKAGLLGMTAAKLAGVPARLYTVHGLPLLTRSGKWRRVLEAAERASSALATRVYSVSHSVRRLVVDLRLCPEAKVSTLGDGSCAGVSLNRFQPAAEGDRRRADVRAAYGIPADALLVSFVGRLARDKGIGVLADAWPEVVRKHPQAHLLLAGEEDGTDPVPQPVLERLYALGSVHRTGTVPATRIPSIYAATDICVLPTFREGLSQVALESGAMGIPIVSCDVSGLDAVKHGETGLLVAPGAPGPLAAAIGRLASDASLRQKMGHAAAAHVRERFSEDRVNQLWMAEYRSLVRDSRAQAGVPQGNVL